MNCFHINRQRKRWLFIMLMLILFDYYSIKFAYYKSLPETRDRQLCCNTSTKIPNVTPNENIILYYKYPLINSSEVLMDYEKEFNSSYYWFQSMKHLFKNLANDDAPLNTTDTPNCLLNESSLGQILVNKTELQLDWVEQQHRDVKLGGYHAPAHCRSTHRVAIIVPYRNRERNLAIFLYYIHKLLKKQLLDYGIFIVEQFGTEKFNKGKLYNIAFLETQRFGTWNCLIFHDVDLIPEDERISYSCPEHPTHMSSSVEMFDYKIPYPNIFGGVVAFTPVKYESVNGFSNLYWSWGAEDDNMYLRLLQKNVTILRYNSSIARYAALSHPRNEIGQIRFMFLRLSEMYSRHQGLTTTKYNVIRVTRKKLYTHILADVNPTKMKIDSKSQLQNFFFH